MKAWKWKALTLWAVSWVVGECEKIVIFHFQFHDCRHYFCALFKLTTDESLYIRDKQYNFMFFHWAGQYLYSYEVTNPTDQIWTLHDWQTVCSGWNSRISTFLDESLIVQVFKSQYRKNQIYDFIWHINDSMFIFQQLTILQNLYFVFENYIQCLKRNNNKTLFRFVKTSTLDA